MANDYKTKTKTADVKWKWTVFSFGSLIKMASSVCKVVCNSQNSRLLNLMHESPIHTHKKCIGTLLRKQFWGV